MSYRLCAFDGKGRPMGYAAMPSRWRFVDGVFENDETAVVEVQRSGEAVRLALLAWPDGRVVFNGPLECTARVGTGDTIQIPVGCVRLEPMGDEK